MESNIYEKSENGYILRERNAETVVIFVIILILGLIYPFEAFVVRSEDALQDWEILAMTGIFLVCVVMAMLYLCAECHSIALDEKGVCVHRPFARAMCIAWEDVRDWGIVHLATPKGFCHYFYFSKVSLRPTKDGKNKKIPPFCRKTAYIRVETKDYPLLQRTGVISFSRGQLVRCTKRFPPMFVSGLSEPTFY